MERAELESLDRDTLIAKAEGAGVVRARILTRPELIDELLLRAARSADPSTLSRARGFFGRARDLLARVVEKGLHLPDTADRIRSIAPPAPVGAHPARAAAALPTVTLAEIYATQGHRDRAVETLRRVLEREPDHGAARALLAQLEDTAYVAPKPLLPPEEDAPPAYAEADEPRAAEKAARPVALMRDEAPLPTTYGVDECVAIPVDPTTLFVYWEVKESTRAYLARTRPEGALTLRLVLLLPTWDGPRTQQRDHEAGALGGDHFVRDLPIGTIVRAAIGWRAGGAFVVIAQSPALETPPGAPAPVAADVLMRWTAKGAQRVQASDADAPRIAHAVELAREKLGAPGASSALGAAAVAAERAGTSVPLGSSERMGGGVAVAGARALGSSERTA